jgi:hypothetical protein
MRLCHVYGAVSAFYDLPSQLVFLVCFHRADMALAHFFVSWGHMVQLKSWQPVVVLYGCFAYASGALAYFCCALMHCALGVHNNDSSLFFVLACCTASTFLFTSISNHTLKRHSLFSL